MNFKEVFFVFYVFLQIRAKEFRSCLKILQNHLSVLQEVKNKINKICILTVHTELIHRSKEFF